MKASITSSIMLLVALSTASAAKFETSQFLVKQNETDWYTSVRDFFDVFANRENLDSSTSMFIAGLE